MLLRNKSCPEDVLYSVECDCLVCNKSFIVILPKCFTFLCVRLHHSGVPAPGANCGLCSHFLPARSVYHKINNMQLNLQCYNTIQYTHVQKNLL